MSEKKLEMLVIYDTRDVPGEKIGEIVRLLDHVLDYCQRREIMVAIVDGQINQKGEVD
jgi:hypothetical protein